MFPDHNLTQFRRFTGAFNILTKSSQDSILAVLMADLRLFRQPLCGRKYLRLWRMFKTSLVSFQKLDRLHFNPGGNVFFLQNEDKLCGRSWRKWKHIDRNRLLWRVGVIYTRFLTYLATIYVLIRELNVLYKVVSVGRKLHRGALSLSCNDHPKLL